jgi:hypothetical protein
MSHEINRVFYLAQAAHRHTDLATKRLRAHRRATKNPTAENYGPMVRALEDAKTEIDQAVTTWQTIQQIIRDNPDLQAEA